jgi:hypothetical protein
MNDIIVNVMSVQKSYEKFVLIVNVMNAQKNYETSVLINEKMKMISVEMEK